MASPDRKNNFALPRRRRAKRGKEKYLNMSKLKPK
jgi:hypothetical protein